jgi:oligoribonuclease NrnB/cAMP/cGMP phosphodiesterase (DHH superfamily)
VADIIYYHSACPDGWAAAYIAKRLYPEADLRPLDHGLTKEQIRDIVDEATGKDVLMLDYSLRSRQDNDWLAKVAKSFQIYDHHRTAQAVLEGAPYATFDMNRSGAGLAWDYLFGRDSTGEWTRDREEREGGVDIGTPRPWWVAYTEARDLWRWDALPNAREVCAHLGTLEFSKDAYDLLDHIDAEDAAYLGRGALNHIQHFVRETVKNVRYGVLDNYKVAVLNATYLNCSEIGNELAKTADFSLTWFERKNDVIHFSLRSIGDFDVSAIAKRFYGGGHKNAAGFQLPYREGRELIDVMLSRVG